MGGATSVRAKYAPSVVNEVVNDYLELATSNEDPTLIERFDQMAQLYDETKKVLESKQDAHHKDTGVIELLTSLGGEEKVKELSSKSMRLIADVDASLPQESRFLDQHIIYEGAGLEKLIHDGGKVKPVFDDLCEKVCGVWSEKYGLQCDYISAPVKGFPRASVKVRVELNGKVTKLKDIVRGTLQLNGKVGLDTLEKVYDALHDLIRNVDEIKPGAKVVRMKDRYQRPSGKYRDFLLNIKIGTFICELQVNFAAALENKKNVDHIKYETDRFARSSLLDAAMKGDTTAVKLFLSTGVSIKDLCDSNGCSPLSYAALYGTREMVVALLDHGADALAKDESGWLPVQYALSQESVEVANILFDHMLKMDLEGRSYDLPFALSSTLGMALASPAMATAEKSAFQLLDKVVPTKEFKMVYAAGVADFKACTRILDLEPNPTGNGAIFDMETGMAARALDFAVISGAPARLVELLVKFGYKIGASNLHKCPQERALQYTVKDQDARMRVLLQLEALKVSRFNTDAEWGSPDWPGTPLNHLEIVKAAARAQSQKVLRTMIQHGFALSERIPELEEQLRAAALRGDVESCELLLDLKVDIEAKNNQGMTPLQVSAQTSVKVCEMLIKRGADPNSNENAGWTVAHRAAQHGRRDILQLLSKAGADMNAETSKGSTPAAIARNNGKLLTQAFLENMSSQA